MEIDLPRHTPATSLAERVHSKLACQRTFAPIFHTYSSKTTLIEYPLWFVNAVPSRRLHDGTQGQSACSSGWMAIDKKLAMSVVCIGDAGEVSRQRPQSARHVQPPRLLRAKSIARCQWWSRFDGFSAANVVRSWTLRPEPAIPAILGSILH